MTKQTTSTSRVAKLRQDRKAAGMVPITYLWTWPKYVDRIKNFVAKLNKGE